MCQSTPLTGWSHGTDSARAERRPASQYWMNPRLIVAIVRPAKHANTFTGPTQVCIPFNCRQPNTSDLLHQTGVTVPTACGDDEKASWLHERRGSTGFHGSNPSNTLRSCLVPKIEYTGVFDRRIGHIQCFGRLLEAKVNKGSTPGKAPVGRVKPHRSEVLVHARPAVRT